MSMMDGIDAAASGLASAQLQQSYSIALSKKAMDAQETAVQGLLEMLPASPGGAQYQFDVYA